VRDCPTTKPETESDNRVYLLYPFTVRSLTCSASADSAVLSRVTRCLTNAAVLCVRYRHFAKLAIESRSYNSACGCGSNVCQGTGASVMSSAICIHNNRNPSLSRHRGNYSNAKHTQLHIDQETLACYLTTYLERRRLVGELAQW
jgi:hypothetical protein